MILFQNLTIQCKTKNFQKKNKKKKNKKKKNKKKKKLLATKLTNKNNEDVFETVKYKISESDDKFQNPIVKKSSVLENIEIKLNALKFEHKKSKDENNYQSDITLLIKNPCKNFSMEWRIKLDLEKAQANQIFNNVKYKEVALGITPYFAIKHTNENHNGVKNINPLNNCQKQLKDSLFINELNSIEKTNDGVKSIAALISDNKKILLNNVYESDKTDKTMCFKKQFRKLASLVSLSDWNVLFILMKNRFKNLDVSKKDTKNLYITKIGLEKKFKHVLLNIVSFYIKGVNSQLKLEKPNFMEFVGSLKLKYDFQEITFGLQMDLGTIYVLKEITEYLNKNEDFKKKIFLKFTFTISVCGKFKINFDLMGLGAADMMKFENLLDWGIKIDFDFSKKATVSEIMKQMFKSKYKEKARKKIYQMQMGKYA